ncbi:hypothetical protein R1sor_014338 [Riccia sorocarpa]|uniref:Uncharacterized protein n=1 Tax=Riccia sorocarpa TaxID=122646 RepID=A0ABD3HD05_9MARC
MHKIKCDLSKEQGTPGACYVGVHLRSPTENESTGLTDEIHDFTDEVYLSGSFMEGMGSNAEREIHPIEPIKDKKRRNSKDNEDEVQKCMLEFTQVIKETNEMRFAQEDRRFEFMVAQEQGKMNLMNQMLELKRMELEILRNVVHPLE